MNQKTTYELTITRKLDQLPIPDLRESIWARIEGELDADMPTDDGGDTPPSAPKGGGRVLPYALPGIVVIIIAVFLTIPKKQNPKSNNIPATAPVNSTTTTSAPSASPPPADVKTIQPTAKDPVIYPGTSIPVTSTPVPTDSVTAPLTDVTQPVTDNTNQQPPLVLTPPPQPVKTDSVAQKKKRGVSGITDNDYRITPVKPDSSRKNN